MAADGWEYKTVKVPVGKPAKQEKVLNREARDGWELVEVQKGPVLRAWNLATLRRARAAR